MKRLLSKRLAALLLTSALASSLLVACGGGGGGTPVAGNTDAVISGVAAVGAPLANAKIVVKDANNAEVTTDALADGSYKANVSGKTAPFMIKATGVVAGVSTSYYSALETAPKSGETLTANVTPLTHAIVAQSSSGDPTTVFADVKANKASIEAAKVQAAKDKLMAALNDYIVALGGTANADPVKTKFNVNSTDALDKVLDLVKVNTQVTTTAGATGADVSLTPNGGATTTITQTDTATSAATKKPTPPTAAEIALDTTGIQTLINSVNATWASSAAYGTNGANFAVWLDDSMLDEGRNKTAFLTSLTDAFNSSTSTLKWGAKIETPVIQRCDTSTKICELALTMNKGSGVYDKFTSTVKKDAASGKWLVYGDRTILRHQLNWVTQKQSDGTYNYGMNLYIPYDNNQTYNVAILTFSADSGTTVFKGKDWNGNLKALGIEFGRPTATTGNCSNNPSFLVFQRHQFTDANGTSGLEVVNCSNSNFFAMGSTTAEADANIKAYNDALTAGTLRYKIKLLNTTTTPVLIKEQDWIKPPPVLGVLSSNVANYASNFPTVTTAQLGTNSVAYASTGTMDSVQIRVKTNNVLTGETWWSGTSASTLGGVASVAKAKALCLSNSSQTQCDTSYGTSGVITWLHLSSHDAQGRQYWAGYGTY